MINDLEEFMEENTDLYPNCTFCVKPSCFIGLGDYTVSLIYNYGTNGFVQIVSRFDINNDMNEDKIKEETIKAREKINNLLKGKL